MLQETSQRTNKNAVIKGFLLGFSTKAEGGKEGFYQMIKSTSQE